MAHSVSRSTLFAGLLASALVALAAPAEAKKKKAEPAAEAPAADSESPGEAKEEKKGPAAAQAGDVERPKPIIDDAGEARNAPKADAEGNVSFAGARSGKGKITVQAPPKENVKVYLEGRYFGVAPRTINKIPPGDYIVEVVFPNGKSMSKPVSVAGEEEAVVTVGAEDALPAAQAAKPMSSDQAQKRWDLAKVVGIGAVGAFAAGLGVGIWEYTVQKDYDKVRKNPPAGNEAPVWAAHVARLKSIEDKGSTLSLTANILFVAGAVALVTAGFIGYPAYKARHAEQKPTSPEGGTNMSFMIVPNPSLNGGTAGMVLQF